MFHRSQSYEERRRVLKKICAACSEQMPSVTKEHFWPRWLIQKTNTHRTGVKWEGDKYINPQKATVPLCAKCNHDFGAQLEGPMSSLLPAIEAGHGLSDNEAELVIRWLWKFEGLAWQFAHPDRRYTRKYTLRQRVLNRIDEMRPHLILAVSLAERIEDGFDDEPMGLDTPISENATCVGGVFGRVAMIVLLADFRHMLPAHMSIHQLKAEHDDLSDTKLFFPKTGFRACSEAVYVMRQLGDALATAHDELARKVRARFPE